MNFSRAIKVAAIVRLAKMLEIPETYTVYLHTGGEESNIRRFLVVAYHVACAMHNTSSDRRKVGEERFKEIIGLHLRTIQDEVRHDGPEVMNMVGVMNEIEEAKELIFRIAERLPNALGSLRELAGHGRHLEDFFRDCVGIEAHHYAGERLR